MTCSHTNNGKSNTRQLYSHKYSWWIQHVTCSHTNNGKGIYHKTTRQPQVQLVDTTCDMFSHHHSKGNTRRLDSHKYSWWIQHVTCSHTNNGKGNTRRLDSHKYSWWIQHVTCSHTNNGKGNTRLLDSHK